MENQQDNYIGGVKNAINIILRKKKFLIILFLCAIAISIVVSLLTPKLYESNATIQIGNLDGFLISKEDLKAQILNRYFLSNITKELALNLDSKVVESHLKISDTISPNLIKISMQHTDPEVALKIVELISNKIVFQGQEIYFKKSTILNERLSELDLEIKNAQKDIDRAQELIAGLSKLGVPVKPDLYLRIILLQNTLPSYESNLTLLRNQKSELKLLFVDAKEFEIFDPAVKQDNPIVYNSLQRIIVSGFVGLSLGVIFILFKEFWKRI